jgi:hypothetical protein
MRKLFRNLMFPFSDEGREITDWINDTGEFFPRDPPK